MRNLVLALLATVFFIGCTPATTSVSTLNTSTSPTPTATPGGSSTPAVGTVIQAPAGFGTLRAVLYDGTTVTLWDGTNFFKWSTGSAVKATGSGLSVSVGTSLYTFSSTGSATVSTTLPTTPKLVALAPPSKTTASRSLARTASVTSGGNVWTFSTVTPAEMAAAGYGSGTWTHVFENSTEILPWYLGTVGQAFAAGDGDVIVQDANNLGKFTDLTTTLPDPILNAVAGGPIILENSTDFTVIDVTGTSYVYPVASIGPNPGNPTQFWEEGTTWYSTGGATWSATAGWNAYGSALKNFTAMTTVPSFLGLANGVQPCLVYAGDSGGISYLLEAVSGHMVAFNTTTNTYTDLGQVFAGQTTDNSAGFLRAETLEPVTVSGVTYWHYDGSLWETTLATGTTEIFSPDQQMWTAQ